MTEQEMRVELADKVAHHCNFLQDLKDLGAHEEVAAQLNSKWMFVETSYGSSAYQYIAYDLFNKETAKKSASLILYRHEANLEEFKYIEVKFLYYRNGKLSVEKVVQNYPNLSVDSVLDNVVSIIPKAVFERFIKGFEKLDL